jgi:predicted metal-dependent enzyme (double-stranded beta helix superfamily)
VRQFERLDHHADDTVNAMPAPLTPALQNLVDVATAALDNASLVGERAKCDAMRDAMAAVLAADDGVPEDACASLDGNAVGNLLYAALDGRFHILAVVFPEGTSSGVHHHGCWGVIGYLRGGDEETRYGGVDAPREHDTAELVEASRHVWHQGDITYLLPDEGDGWHRVRNPGPGDGVSIHVLCMTPSDHPHLFWDRATGAVSGYPFVEVAPDRWQARITSE